VEAEAPADAARAGSAAAPAVVTGEDDPITAAVGAGAAPAPPQRVHPPPTPRSTIDATRRVSVGTPRRGCGSGRPASTEALFFKLGTEYHFQPGICSSVITFGAL
jgi:hypothetical protein